MNKIKQILLFPPVYGLLIAFIITLITAFYYEGKRQERLVIYNEMLKNAKYEVGDKVRVKGLNKIGVIRNIIKAEYWYNDIPRYRIIFSIDNTAGIDTAAGSGFLGDTRHFKPSVFTDIILEETLLERVK